MREVKTTRPYRERFLDGFDRSELRREVERLPRRRGWLKKKYTTWALGASLAFGGVGIPMQVIQQSMRGGEPALTASPPIDRVIVDDLAEAQSIAQQVASGVEAAARGAREAATAPLKGVAEAPQKFAIVTDAVKESFFRTEIPFGSIIYREAKKNDLAPELVAAVVKAESRFKPTARSQAGAIGLMQLVPRTGRWMGARDLTNPVQNIAAGTKYLKYLHERFDGNEQKVIAAYNAGEGNVRRFGGIPPFRETRNYVTRVRTYERELREQIETHIAEAAPAAAVTR